VDPAVADLTAARANASLSWTETELLRRVNCAVDEDVPMWLYHRLVTDVLALKVLPGRGEPGRVPLPADRRAWAEEKAGELVGAARRAGGRRAARGGRPHDPRASRTHLHAAPGDRRPAARAPGAAPDRLAQTHGPAPERAEPGGLEDAGRILASRRAAEGHRA